MTARDRIVLDRRRAVGLLGGFWFLALAPKRNEASRSRRRSPRQQQSLDRRAPPARRRGATAKAPLRARLRDRRPPRQGRAGRRRRAVARLPAPDGRAGANVDFRSLKLDRLGELGAPPTLRPDRRGRRRRVRGRQTNGASPTRRPRTTAPATQAAAAALPPGATVGAAGFPTMPFTFTFEGSFFDHASASCAASSASSQRERQERPRQRPPADRRRRSRWPPAATGFPQRQGRRRRATAYLLPADRA